MTPTEQLREFLDEIGVKWKRVRGHKSNGTSWYDKYGSYVEAVQEYAFDGCEWPEDKMAVRRGPTYMTPEELVESTLGLDSELKSIRTCVMKRTHFPNDREGEYWLTCSECGYMLYAHENWCPIRYCSHCGRKVENEG